MTKSMVFVSAWHVTLDLKPNMQWQSGHAGSLSLNISDQVVPYCTVMLRVFQFVYEFIVTMHGRLHAQCGRFALIVDCRPFPDG